MSIAADSVDPAETSSRGPAQVSVVIPTYNCWPWLRRAVLSVLAQTWPALEIIVVDDGSTDDTRNQLTVEFADRVRYVQQPNGGPSKARNAGARLSSGAWIAFLDADDEWVPEKLERQLARGVASGAALVACEAVIRDESGRVVAHRRLPRPFDRRTVVRALRIRTAIPMGVLVKRDVFLGLNGFDETLMCGEDREMWARIVARHEIAAVHEPLLLVTERAQGISGNGERVLRDGLVINRRVRRLLPSGPPFGFATDFVTLRKADSNIYWSAAWLSASSRQRALAMRQALRSLWLFPFSNVRKKVGLCYRLATGKMV